MHPALFGAELTEAVAALTKPWARQRADDNPDPGEREAREEAYFKRIKHAQRFVQRVKVFDRLNNLACVHERPRSKQLEYVAETERFHLPLAQEVDPELATQMKGRGGLAHMTRTAEAGAGNLHDRFWPGRRGDYPPTGPATSGVAAHIAQAA